MMLRLLCLAVLRAYALAGGHGRSPASHTYQALEAVRATRGMSCVGAVLYYMEECWHEHPER